jgi:hypothetical protein
MYDLEYEPVKAVATLAGRWDLYGPIHKGLRLAHATMMRRLGSADWAGDDPSALLADLREHLRLGAKHLAHEEAYVHPALEARDPGSTAGLDRQHEHHRARFAVLEAQISALEVAFRADRPALGRDLYLGFTLLVAEDLAHMHEEETATWPRLCAAFTDAELQAIEGTIVASLSPDDVVAFMRMMIPAMNRPERAILLGAMKADAPPAAFAAVLSHAARPTLDPEDWADLQARLR